MFDQNTQVLKNQVSKEKEFGKYNQIKNRLAVEIGLPEQMAVYQQNLDFILDKENNMDRILKFTAENIGEILENTKKELSGYSNGRPEMPEIVAKQEVIAVSV